MISNPGNSKKFKAEMRKAKNWKFKNLKRKNVKNNMKKKESVKAKYEEENAHTILSKN